MKKIFLILLSTLLVFNVIACSETSDPQDPPESPHIICSYGNWTNVDEPSCTEAGSQKRVCTVCGNIQTKSIPALGHTTTNGTCSRCNKSFGGWVKKYYVDEFGLPTSTPYITNSQYFVGVFSNSATTNSKLYVSILVDSKDIAIMLYEYGSHKVKSYSTEEYSIILLDTENNRHNISGTMYKNGDRIHIDSAWESSVINYLKKPGTISIYLEHDRYTTSTYLFSFETSNFSNLYNTL